MRGKFNKSDTFVYLLTKSRLAPDMQKLSSEKAYVLCAKDIVKYATIKLKRTNRQPVEVRKEWFNHYKNVKTQAMTYTNLTEAEKIVKKWTN